MKPDPHDYPLEEPANRLREGWAIRPDSLVQIRDGANNVFKARSEGGYVFVKITAGSIRSESDVRGSTAFLHHLGERGAPVSRLILRADGARYEVMEHGGRRYYISVLEAAPGTGIDLTNKDPKVFAAWGEALARLHNASEDFDASGYDYLTGDGEWDRILERCTAENPAILDLITEIGEWRNALPRPQSGLPLTHGDMNAGNIIVDGPNATLIDFDEPVFIWYAADIARPFRETWDQTLKERRTNFDAFLGAYAREREPDFTAPRDYENFCILKNLEGLGWLRHVWEGEDAFGEPTAQTLKSLEIMLRKPLRLA